MALYRGFSTVNRRKKYRINDFECAKQSLFNHLHTRKGERLMNPNFGTIIWDLLFEPLTPDVKTVIADDLKKVVSYDPRIAVENITVAEYEHGIQVSIDLRYVETDQTDVMRISFDKNTLA